MHRHRLAFTRPGVYRIVNDVKFRDLSDFDTSLGGWLDNRPLDVNQPHPVPELPPLVDSRVEDAADVGRPAAGADERAPIPD